MDRDPARVLTVATGVLWALAVWAPRNRGWFAGFAVVVNLTALAVQGRVTGDELRNLRRVRKPGRKTRTRRKRTVRRKR